MCSNMTHAHFRFLILPAAFMAAVALLASAPGARAQPVDDTFTYQGLLKLNGAVVDGATDMSFYLWDSQVGGNMIGLPTAQSAVPVSEGKFTVDLNFDAPDFSGSQRWLAIAVRYPAGSGSYTFLNPRQPLRATPYSVTALSALSVTGMDGHSLNAADGNPIDALYADNAGSIGIGTTSVHSNFKMQLTGGAGSWKGGIAAGGATSATVMGEVSGVATIGGHNGALSAWSNLSINPIAGNVGIGTSTPGAKLHVNGDIRGNWLAVGYAGTPLNQGLYLDDDHIDTLLGAPLQIQANSLGPVNIAGNLGLGTSSPTNKLSVVGNGDFTGDVGIGTAAPGAPLHINTTANPTGAIIQGSNTFGTWLSIGHTAGGQYWHLGSSSAGSMLFARGSAPNSFSGYPMAISGSGNVGIGTLTPNSGFQLQVAGGTGAWRGAIAATGTTNSVVVGEANGVATIGAHNAALTAWTDLAINPGGGDVLLAPNGTTQVRILEILGADVAERFLSNDEIAPGMVVMIDVDHPGNLRLARGRYNRKVAGIASGANGLPAGTILGNLPGHEDAAPIALSGRVWCWCDADQAGAIEAGDMLTTSDTLGHAMRCADKDQAYGAVIGKAMTSLKSGKGLVLVLVSLQ